MDKEDLIFPIIILSICLIVVTGISIYVKHTESMAKLGYCQVPMFGSSNTTWQKCQ